MTAAQRKAFVGAGVALLWAGVVISRIAWDRFVNQPMQAPTTCGWKVNPAGNNDEQTDSCLHYLTMRLAMPGTTPTKSCSTLPSSAPRITSRANTDRTCPPLTASSATRRSSRSSSTSRAPGANEPVTIKRVAND